MSIKNALRELLDNLDKVSDHSEEIFDTTVREHLYTTIDDHFVHPSPEDDFPLRSQYAMFSDEADDEIYSALAQFLNHPEVRAALAHMTPEERFNAFQDDVESSNGSFSDDYFGGWGEYRPRS